MLEINCWPWMCRREKPDQSSGGAWQDEASSRKGRWKLTSDEDCSALEVAGMLLLDDSVDGRPGVPVLTVAELDVFGVLLTEPVPADGVPLGIFDTELDVITYCEVVAKDKTVEEDKVVMLLNVE